MFISDTKILLFIQEDVLVSALFIHFLINMIHLKQETSVFYT